MGVTVRQFIESLSNYGILSSAEVTSIREATTTGPQDADCEQLLRDLVRQSKLTKFQATNLYQGRARGLVFGEYVILDKLGAGGMGQVYKAQHKRMKRVVALKVLPPQAVKSQKSVERFHQEVEVAAKLTHPNIVTAYDAGEAHGMHYLVMEYVDGKDLSSHITKNGPLTLEQTLNVVLQTARGLAYAHGLNIVHRDIKPSNLLIDRKGVVKILDMGLARVGSIDNSEPGKELTADGEVMGTMDYMAPEQAVDTRSADHRADIYSLGCTLYRLYTGQTPYTGETAVQKILAHRDKPIPSLRAARPEAPDMVDRMFQKMLAKDPVARTQSMVSIVSSLERMLSGVDDDRSSVMLGAEPVDADAGFLGGSAIGGNSGLGSSLGGSSAAGLLPGSSGVNVGASPAQPAVVVRTGGPPLPTAARSTSPTVAGKSAGRDTDAIVRSIMQAKPAPPKDEASKTTKPPNRVPLYVGGAIVVAAVIGLAAFFLLRKSDPPPEVTASVVATPTEPPVDAPSASSPTASASATAAPSAKLPEFPTATPAAPDFFGRSPPQPSGTPPAAPPPSSNGNAPPPPQPTGNPPPPVAPQPVAAPTEITGEIDLLATIDPAKHSRTGVNFWSRSGADITAGNGQHGIASYLDVPFMPPEEYDLTCVAVPMESTAAFGPGLVFGGSSLSVIVQNGTLGLSRVDGKNAFDGANPSLRQGRFFSATEPVEIVCAVRRRRIVVTINGKRVLEQELTPDRVTPEHLDQVTPGQLHLRSTRQVRFTTLTIGPPQLPASPSPASVNLAAAFEAADVIEGIGTATRGGIAFGAEPNKYARLAFSKPRPRAYVVTAVVERTTGGDMFGLGLPIGPHRTVALFDWRLERFSGLQWVPPGGMDINPTGRRYGWLLTSGEQHVVRAEVAPEGNNWRVRTTLDGREIVNYAGNNFSEDQPQSVPDRQAIAAVTWSSGWRIVRLDLGAVDGARAAVPGTDARAKAAAALTVLTRPADVKGAALDDKLSAVDNLRRKAATDLDDAALRYAALDEALRIAAAAGDLSGAYEAAEDLYTTFDVDPHDVQSRVLDVFKATRSTQADAKKQFADEAFKLMDRAAKSEQWDYAFDLNAALDKLAGSNADLKRELKARAAEYAFAKSLFEPAATTRAKLAGGDKLDPAEHTALGKYLCFALADWATGLKALTAGDDGALAAVAAMEPDPGKPHDVLTGDAKFALAEKWWELSQKEKTNGLKWAEAERAALWYRRAAGVKLADKSRTSLPRQMTAIAQLRKTSGGAGGPRRPPDAVKLGDHWYKVYLAPMMWETAVQTCEQLGGNLVIVDTPAENQAVAQFVLQSLGSQASERASIWLGASDVEQEGLFRRLDGVPLPTFGPSGGPPPAPPPGAPPGPPPFAKWAGGEPNNANGDEDFVAMEISLQNNQIGTDWRDYNRGAWCYVVCEWDH